MKIKLTKLKEVDNPTHPNNIEEGYEIMIDIFENSFEIPQVGERFDLMGEDRGFITSVVREIIDESTFRTLNSIYKWEIIKNEEA